MTEAPPDPRSATRITWGLFLAHAFGSAGIICTATVAAIVGAELSGRAALSGVPAAAAQIGGALAALLVGAWTERFGRRRGLTAAAALGVGGMTAAAASAVTGTFVLLVVGLLVSGAAGAAVKFARFTAAEVQPRARRGRAVATVVMGGTVGSVLGPVLVAPSGAAAVAAGLPELAGPYLVTVLLFGAAALAFQAFLRPEPRELAAYWDARERSDAGPDREEPPVRPLTELIRDPGVATAMATLVLAQAVMVMVMAITSLHMHVHHHALASISVVIAGHTLGMYAFSVVSGFATDRYGRLPVLLTGGGVLFVSCVLAPLSPAFVPLFLALFLLGVGWNLCYVAGSAWLTDCLRTAEKARTQGVNDLFMGTVSAASSLGGGVVFAVFGYGAMAAAGAVGAAALIVLVARYARGARTVAA
ncbi:MAG: MFS transporter [Trueperaceae bacterium]